MEVERKEGKRLYTLSSLPFPYFCMLLIHCKRWNMDYRRPRLRMTRGFLPSCFSCMTCCTSNRNHQKRDAALIRDNNNKKSPRSKVSPKKKKHFSVFPCHSSFSEILHPGKGRIWQHLCLDWKRQIDSLEKEKLVETG